MAEIDFITRLHTATKRNYLERVVEHDKAECAEVAGRFGQEYWDGDRRYGYGGYHYDGRWRAVAERMVAHYGLTADSRILDVGCGKAFLLYEFTQLVPGIRIVGVDVSQYGLEHAKEEVRPHLFPASSRELPFDSRTFDLVISLNVFHNLPIYDLWPSLQEMERVGRKDKYVVVEAFRNEREKVNLLYWQLTCRAFHSDREWKWIFDQVGYRGDYGFIYFE